MIGYFYDELHAHPIYMRSPGLFLLCIIEKSLLHNNLSCVAWAEHRLNVIDVLAKKNVYYVLGHVTPK